MVKSTFDTAESEQDGPTRRLYLFTLVARRLLGQFSSGPVLWRTIGSGNDQSQRSFQNQLILVKVALGFIVNLSFGEFGSEAANSMMTLPAFNC